MFDQEITIIKDSREPSEAWDMYFKSQCEVKALKTGDYSILGYENSVAAERKTLDDLVGCLGKSRDRFERELLRSTSMEFFCVLVEASYFELAEGIYRSRLHLNSAVESISAFEIRYRVPFLFCGNQELAAKKCESLLKKFHREKMKQNEDEFPF